jgi:hypothetical protein
MNINFTLISTLGTGALNIISPGDPSDSSIYDGPEAQSILTTINNTMPDGSPGDKFGSDSCYNNGSPYLFSTKSTFQSSCNIGNFGSFFIGNFSTILQTERVDRINDPKGFVLVKPDFNKINLELLPDKVNNSFAEITGIKTSTNQASQVFLKVGEDLQVSLNSEGKQPLQLWVRSPNGELILFGIITFDENGNAVLPAIEFKNSGQFEFLFINSENLLDQPDLINKVGGLTITVN